MKPADGTFADRSTWEEKRPRLLFVGEAVTLAHVVRPLALAQSLDPGRYRIFFACGERYRTLVEAAGFEFHALPTLEPEKFMRRAATGAMLYDRDTLERYVRAEEALLRTLRPDLVVGDLRLSLSISTECAGIRYVNLCNAHWSPYSTLNFPTPEFTVTRFLGVTASGWVLRNIHSHALRHYARGYNAMRRARGLEPVEDVREMLTRGNWTWYLDLPRLAPTTGLPHRHAYLGPVVWSPSQELPADWAAIRGSGPLVYVTLGSSGETRVLKGLVEALGRLPVRAVLATAGRSRLNALPSNVWAAEYLPAREILREAAVCVFNGGAATGYQALEAGVPVLGLPANADQFYHMEGIARLGAGLLMRPSRASPEKIESALATLLEVDSYRANARTLQREFQDYPAAARFGSWVEQVLGLGDVMFMGSQSKQDLELEVNVRSEIPTARILNNLGRRETAEPCRSGVVLRKG